MKYNFKYILLLALLAVLFDNCTEPYPLTSLTYEEYFVVDATVTDSLQYQTIKLSKSSVLNSDTLNYVNNASLSISSSTGDIYSFHQIASDSTYISDIPFKAEQGKSYQLKITTPDGKEYISTNEETPQEINIDNIYATNYTNELGIEGIEVYANVSGNGSNTIYTRYEYEETYKIVTPYTLIYDVNLTNVALNCQVGTCGTYCYDINITGVDNPQLHKICYSTQSSNELLLATSSEQSANAVTGVPIKFIAKDDYSISERYSILVKAYSESYDAYQYYRLTQKISGEGQSFSPTQPGFIYGNISNVSNANEQVVGYFNIVTVKKKRIFFDHSDFNYTKPNYFADCEPVTYDYDWICPRGGVPPYNVDHRVMIYQYLNTNNYKLLEHQEGTSLYTLIAPECIDCTSFASNVVPDFWVE